MDPLPRCHLRGIGLGFSHFARHYFGNHSLFSLPQGTEMFHFPWLAPASLFIQLEVTPLFTVLGFPIRTSPDQRSVDSSPKLFAATRVLHRLLAPRHPPHALSSLLASISCLRPASRRSLETRNQGPDPCSSQQARKTLSISTHSIRLIRSTRSLHPRRRLTAAAGATGSRVPSARTCYSAEIATYPSYALVKEREAKRPHRPVRSLKTE